MQDCRKWQIHLRISLNRVTIKNKNNDLAMWWIGTIPQNNALISMTVFKKTHLTTDRRHRNDYNCCPVPQIKAKPNPMAFLFSISTCVLG